MQEKIAAFCKAIIAGVAIGLGCTVNAKIGGTEGAILFATGLVTIIHFRLPLFTGIVAERPELKWIFILAGNLLGAAVAHYLWGIEMKALPADKTLLEVFLGACGTGFLMVTAYRSKSPLIAIMGVALFILSGFAHCIAEAGYLRMTWPQWLCALAGNFAGGNIWRLMDVEKLLNKEA